MTYKEIEAHAANFFEWPDDNKREVVTFKSCLLFARYCVQLEQKRQQALESSETDDHH